MTQCVVIGWHFLYEGISKVINPYWSSAGFLLESKWIFSRLFTNIDVNPAMLEVVDFLNIWGLITTEDFTEEETWNWCREGLIECARYAGDYGVMLTLQNHTQVIETWKDVVHMAKKWIHLI